jgi:hypothetical protein
MTTAKTPAGTGGPTASSPNGGQQPAAEAARLGVPISAVTAETFVVAARTGVSAAALASWDAGLARPPRVLVPIDVQALVVGQGVSVPAAPVLPQLADPTTTPAAGVDITTAMPPVPPFSPTTDRAPGVYLHWAAPDGVTSTQTLTPTPKAPGADISSSMRPLADRWLVVRVGGGTPRRTRSWILEAERGRKVDLGSWVPTDTAPDDGTSRTPHFPSNRLTAVAGGDPAWAAVYDAVEDRFAMHDDLSDLDPADAAGPLSYLVCGWWSVDANDPLYVADQRRFVETAASLKWAVPTVAVPTAAARDVAATRLAAVGLGQSLVARTDVVDTSGRTTQAAETFVHPAVAEIAGQLLIGQPADHPQRSLLHGCVIGVPPGGQGIDPMPDPSTVEIAVGASATEAFAAILTADVADAAAREAQEQLVEAFSQGLISQLDAADGLVTLDEATHDAGFIVLPGDSVRTDMLMTGDRLAAGAAVAEGRLDALHQTTLSEIADTTTQATAVASTEKQFGLAIERSFHDVLSDRAIKLASAINATVPAPQAFTAVPVDVAAEPYADALDPVVTMRGLVRSLRHGYDGRLAPDDTLACRVSGLEVTSLAGLFDGADAVAPLGNGAVPPECDTLLQELVVDDYTYVDQAAAYVATSTGLPVASVTARMVAEHALRYDTTTASPVAGSVATETGKDLLRTASLRDGMDASPIATTHWIQPWVPMFLEWTVGLRIDESVTGWTLTDTDLDPGAGSTGDPGPAGTTVEYSGRTLLTSVAARTFAAQVQAFVNDEEARGPSGAVIQPDQVGSLTAVASVGAGLDLLSGALTDLHPQLLGLAWADASRSHAQADGTPLLPTPVAAPVLIRSGVAWFEKVRVVDAFGRFVDISPSSVAASASLQPIVAAAPAPPSQVDGQQAAAQVLLRPRFTRPGRTLLDFVDASAADGVDPAPAMVDQSDAGGTVSPVSGWLLPDHFDGALEVFDAAAEPLGMLLEDLGGAVVWEGAPGRPGPAGAPPSALSPADTAARHVVRMAAAMVAADAARRADPTADPDEESALSAMLRVIDTTAWTVDPFGSLGTEHQSVLVGRPIAVLRMQLQLQIVDDLESGADAELNLDAAGLALRQAAYDRLSAQQIAVRLGELTRTDDGVLGYFVDDDYSLFTPVSPEVLAQARASGRLVGQLGALGPDMAAAPAVVPVTHPYVDDRETPLQTRPGQTVRLTVLMAPGGSAHATCGMFPRVETPLSRDWIAPALKLLVPTFRVGPVLVDPAAVRVPKTTGLPKQQVFTSRPDPASWRDDPIAAATQDALLPLAAAVVREGYLRITLPDTADAPASS